MGWDVVALVTLVVLVGGYWAKELAYVATGFLIQILYACDRLTSTQSGDESEEEEPAEANEEPQRNGPQRGGLPAGPCRSCGLVHIGLTPVHVELLPGGNVHVPDGVPFVCPRCWVESNPMNTTNTVPRPVSAMAAQAPASVATGSDNERRRPRREALSDEQRADIVRRASEGEDAKPIELDANIQDVKPIDPTPKQMDFLEPPPKPVHGGRPDHPPEAKSADEMSEAELEKATRPAVTCAKCGKSDDGEYREVKTKPGVFWCQSCVDALGGPGDKARKRRGK